MLTGSRYTATIVLALCVALGVTVTAAGCGGSPATSATSAGSPTAKAGKGSKTSAPAPADVISCLNSHGMSIPAGATTRQVKLAYSALPAAQQQSVSNACSSLLPAKFWQKVQTKHPTSSAT